MDFGNEDVVDPSLFFRAKAYILAQPESVRQGVNFLAHFIKNSASDRIAARAGDNQKKNNRGAARKVA